MNEDQIQHQLIMWFSQEYPQYRGLLFEINNDTYNVKHAMKRRSMGMISGAADLIFVLPGCGRVAGIEMKAPGSKHGIDHIKNQISWGEKIIKNNGFYLITSDLFQTKEFLQYLIIGNFEMADAVQSIKLNEVMKQYNKKTIKF